MALDFTKSQPRWKLNAQAIPGGVASINRLAQPSIAFAKAFAHTIDDIEQTSVAMKRALQSLR